MLNSIVLISDYVDGEEVDNERVKDVLNKRFSYMFTKLKGTEWAYVTSPCDTPNCLHEEEICIQAFDTFEQLENHVTTTITSPCKIFILKLLKGKIVNLKEFTGKEDFLFTLVEDYDVVGKLDFSRHSVLCGDVERAFKQIKESL